MLVVAFGNPGIPPPGFSIWRALRFTVRPRLARVAAGPPGMDQAGAHPGVQKKKSPASATGPPSRPSPREEATLGDRPL
jgi:hypothetical protein